MLLMMKLHMEVRDLMIFIMKSKDWVCLEQLREQREFLLQISFSELLKIMICMLIEACREDIIEKN